MNEVADTCDDRITLDYEFRAGAFMRGRVRFHIERGAADYGVDVHIVEDRRLLASEFLVRISGPRADVEDFEGALDDWVASYER